MFPNMDQQPIDRIITASSSMLRPPLSIVFLEICKRLGDMDLLKSEQSLLRQSIIALVTVFRNLELSSGIPHASISCLGSRELDMISSKEMVNYFRYECKIGRFFLEVREYDCPVISGRKYLTNRKRVSFLIDYEPSKNLTE